MEYYGGAQTPFLALLKPWKRCAVQESESCLWYSGNSVQPAACKGPNSHTHTTPVPCPAQQTNNSTKSRAMYVKKLASGGITATADDIMRYDDCQRVCVSAHAPCSPHGLLLLHTYSTSYGTAAYLKSIAKIPAGSKMYRIRPLPAPLSIPSICGVTTHAHSPRLASAT